MIKDMAKRVQSSLSPFRRNNLRFPRDKNRFRLFTRSLARMGKGGSFKNSKIQKNTKTLKKENWKFVIQTIIAILTAIATSLGVTSCMN